MSSLRDRFVSIFGSRRSGFFRNFQIGSTTPIWVDYGDSPSIYNEVPEIRAVIGQKALMFGNGKWKMKDREDQTIDDDPILELLRNPNVLQSGKEFLIEHKIYEQVTGNGFIYKNNPGFNIKALWCIPSDGMEVDPTGKMFDQVEKSGIIEKYCFKSGKITKNYKPDEILHSKILTSIEPLVAETPFLALQKPISNIISSYKTRNVLTGNMGAFGILSSENKDVDGGIPLSNKERDRIQNEYKQKYGNDITHDDQIIISTSNVKWSPMSYPVKDLLLHEEVEADFRIITDTYGMDMNIFSTSKPSTFENKNMGIKGTYENTIIPEAQSFAESMTKFLGLKDGKKLYLDYSHLPILQKNQKEKAETAQIVANTIESLQRSGTLQEGESRILLEKFISLDNNGQ